MTLLAQLGEGLPERYYLGLDVGYKEHVGAVISLETFVRGGDRWKRSRCLHFPSRQAGLDRFQRYLDGYSPDPQTFLGICEPTGGYYGATVYQYLLDHHYPMWMVENALTRHMREQIVGGIPKTDDTEARVMARICYLHEAVGEEFKLRPLRLARSDEASLMALCRDSWKLSQMIVRERNQFTQLMAVVFPELKTFFFHNYRQYVVYTGYYAGLEKSQTIDRTRMSRRGNRDLKGAYFQIAGPLVWFDRGENPYEALFERKTAAGYPWYKAMPFVCAALARHIYHCLKFKQPYAVEKAFGVVALASEQALLDLQAGLDEQLEVMEAHLISEEA